MRHLKALRRARGVTLIELMIGLAIGAVLLALGMPFFGDYIANSRLREGGNALFAETLFAQSEAIKRNATVRIVVSGSSVQTRDMVAGEPGVLIREFGLPAPVAAAAAVTYNFGSDGRPAPFGTAVAVNLHLPGQTCTSERRCPGLRVDAGGAARLCGDHLSGCP
jgi:type IV fimbrial biogenesis protein FimT